MSESTPLSGLVALAAVTINPSLMTIHPFESIPSPSCPAPALTVTTPPLIVITDTPSSFAFIPSSKEFIVILPPLTVK